VNLKFSYQNWGAYAVGALLILAMTGLQWEIKNLENELRNLRSADAAAAAAVEKLEKDIQANQRADQKAALGTLSEQEAARRRNIDKGLSALPTAGFRSPVYWNGTPPPEKPRN
jgi:septal ring factor EnvC (AmiA/AmiB activator)